MWQCCYDFGSRHRLSPVVRLEAVWRCERCTASSICTVYYIRDDCLSSSFSDILIRGNNVFILVLINLLRLPLPHFK